MTLRNNNARENSFVSKAFSLGLAVTLLLGGTSLVGMTLTGCKTKSPDGSENVDPNEKVATINEKVVTRRDYDAVYKQFMQVFRIEDNPEALKNPMVQESLKRMVLNKLVLNELIAAEAKKRNLEVTPEELKKMKEQQTAAVGGKENLDKLLKENKLTEEEFNATLKEQALIAKLLDALIKDKGNGPDTQVTLAEAKAYYDGHAGQFEIPEGVTSQHILVKAIDQEIKKDLRKQYPSLSEEALEKKVAEEKAKKREFAQHLLEQVKKNPNSIAELAKKYSDDKLSAQNNGMSGLLVQQTTDPSFWAAAKKTKPGAVHDGLVESSFGYHVIRVLTNEKARKQPFAEAQPQIMMQLAMAKKQAIMETWAKAQEKQSKIVIADAYKPKEVAPPGAPQSAPANPNKVTGAAAPAQPAKK